MKTRPSDQTAQWKKRPSGGTALIEKLDRSKARTKKKKKKEKKKKKQISVRSAVDPKKPKKPPTAFFYFLEDFRKTYQEQNPDVKSMRDIGKACGEKWKTMPFDEKVAYYDIATEKRAKFEEEMMAYIKKKRNGEESDSDVDYE